MRKRVSVSGGVLAVKEGKPIEFRLEELRLVYLVGYSNLKFHFISNSTTQSVQVLDLDAEGQGTSAIEALGGVLASTKNSELKKTYLCIADFGVNSIQVSFLDIKRSEADIFGPLAAAQAARQERRREWLETHPQVRLFGGGARYAVLDEKGFAVGKKFIAWEDVETIKILIQESAFIKVASLLAIQKGVSQGAFGWGQYKYSLGHIKLRRTELYYAECLFWKALAASGGVESPLSKKLKTLGALHEQGILSDEKFAEAKAKAIEELV